MAHSIGNTVTGTPSQSNPIEVPNIYTRQQAGQFGNRAADIAGRSVNPNLQSLLESNLMNPAQFGGLSESEKNLVDQAYSGRQAQFNALGIGQSPLAQSAIAAAAAPILASLRQQQMNNLFQGINLGLTERGQNLDTYTNLARLGTPQVAQQSTGQQPGLLGQSDPLNLLNSAIKSGLNVYDYYQSGKTLSDYLGSNGLPGSRMPAVNPSFGPDFQGVDSSAGGGAVNLPGTIGAGAGVVGGPVMAGPSGGGAVNLPGAGTGVIGVGAGALGGGVGGAGGVAGITSGPGMMGTTATAGTDTAVGGGLASAAGPIAIVKGVYDAYQFNKSQKAKQAALEGQWKTVFGGESATPQSDDAMGKQLFEDWLRSQYPEQVRQNITNMYNRDQHSIAAGKGSIGPGGQPLLSFAQTVQRDEDWLASQIGRRITIDIGQGPL